MTVSGGAESTLPSRPAPRRSSAGISDFAAFAASRAAAPGRGVCSPLRAARLILPTRENVEQLACELALKLSSRFAAAGLADDPAVSFSVDAAGGIHAVGGRDDVAGVEALVASDPALQRAIHNAHAIAAHAYDLENGGRLAFQRAYRLSADPHEVVAQYANLLAPARAGSLSLVYCRGGVSVAADGAGWICS